MLRKFGLLFLSITSAVLGADPARDAAAGYPETVGIFLEGFWYLDANGNGVWDGSPADKEHQFGWPGVTPFAGDWNGDGAKSSGIFINGFWFLDVDGNGVWDGPGVDFQAELGWTGVTPIVGDWNGDGRDKIGIYINGFWYVDYNGNGLWDGPAIDRQAHFGWDGVTPFVGDWNGDGRDKIAVYINGYWFYDLNGNYLWDGPGVDAQFHFGWAAATPLVGDWNGDGTDSSGLFANGWWYLDFDGNRVWDGGALDKAYTFGGGGQPVKGDWNGTGSDKIGVFSAGQWLLDKNGNGAWDGPVTDAAFAFGPPGSVPFVGRWTPPSPGGSGPFWHPADGAAGVPRNTRVIVEIPPGVSPGAITTQTFVLRSGATTVPADVAVSKDGRWASLRPKQQLPANTAFTALLSPGGDRSISFATGSGLSLETFRPAPDAPYEFTPPNAQIRIAMHPLVDPTTLDLANVRLQNLLTGQNAPGTATLLDLTTILFQPSKKLAVGTEHGFVYGQGVTNAFGAALAVDQPRFRTGFADDLTPPALVATSPLDGSIGARLFSDIVITMSEPVTGLRSGATVRLLVNGVEQPANALLDGAKVVVRYPSGGFQPSSDYAIFVEGLRDLAGNAAAPISLSFRTQPEGSAPPAATVSPTGNIGLNQNPVITADFNQELAPSSFLLSDVKLSSAAGPAPITVTLTNGNRRILIQPQAPLSLYTESRSLCRWGSLPRRATPFRIPSNGRFEPARSTRPRPR